MATRKTTSPIKTPDQLLREVVVGLVKNHELGTLEQFMNDWPRQARLIQELLEGTVAIKRDAEAKKKANAPITRETLVDIAATDRERGVLLLHLYDGMAAGAFLKSAKEINRFAFDNNLPGVTETAKAKAQQQFLKSMISQPIDRLEHALVNLQPDFRGNAFSGLNTELNRR